MLILMFGRPERLIISIKSATAWNFASDLMLC